MVDELAQRRRFLQWLGATSSVALAALSQGAVAAPRSRLLGVRYSVRPGRTRVVFDLSAETQYKIFSLSNPSRTVIDLYNTKLACKIPGRLKDDRLTRALRAGVQSGGRLRLVLESNKALRAKTASLQPTGSRRHRIVLDLLPRQGSAVQQHAKKPETSPKKIVKKPPTHRDIIIAIDAGHGGKDPGAQGPKRTYEKNITLALARELERLLKKEPGVKPVMIRRDDSYVGLRERVRRARDQRADLLVSLHADSYRNAKVSGSSVYVLSNKGASSAMARFLAEKENAADLVGMGTPKYEDEVLNKTLLDLTVSATRESSIGAAERVLSRIGKVNKLHKKRVERAGFMVLKSPDVPSFLIEAAFLSNPSEERKLRSKQHQRKLASAIHRGVMDYFSVYPPYGTQQYARLQEQLS